MEIKNKNNAIAVLKHLKKEALLPDNLIKGMMANIAVETGGSFDYETKQKGRKNPAYGLFQFDPLGGLYGLYQEYLEYTRSEDSAERQLDLLVDILLKYWPKGIDHVGRGNVMKVLRAADESAESATIAFCDHILRPGKPHLERRLQALVEVEELFNECYPI